MTDSRCFLAFRSRRPSHENAKPTNTTKMSNARRLNVGNRGLLDVSVVMLADVQFVVAPYSQEQQLFSVSRDIAL